ncbi:sialidase-1-like [Patiria miniata]|uniref:Sialidase-1 n=1 Tax=Patiria miniata TaxID=46514 RepID=A0A913Z6I9_PATMI|nr:sialidase-1-like [Patiria miniata]
MARDAAGSFLCGFGRASCQKFFAICLLSLLLSHVTLAQPSAKVNPSIASQRPLWRAGEAEVVIYRIPLLSYTPGGRLLAVAEARKYTGGDAGPKFMVIRRSLDDLGDEWEPMQVIVDDGYLTFDGLNLGNIIVDDEKAIIFIMFTVCNHHDGCDVTSTKLIRSLDDGVTWSKAMNISEQIGTQVFAPGPGSGFQKKYAPNKGRLVSCGHGSLYTDGIYCLLSDDHGMTWFWGGSVIGIPYGQEKVEGDFVPDECQGVELPNGTIMINARNQYRFKCPCRIVAWSFDGGETLPIQDVYQVEALIEPACAAGLLYHRNVLLFSNPKSTTARVALTLQWSYDNGTTWNGEYQIWDKASGYSTMTAHPGASQYIFILFEKGITLTTESIEFVRVSLYEDV